MDFGKEVSQVMYTGGLCYKSERALPALKPRLESAKTLAEGTGDVQPSIKMT